MDKINASYSDINAEDLQIKIEPINILGIRVFPITRSYLRQYISNVIIDNSHAKILHANVHSINLSYQNPLINSYWNSADLVFCDGAGVRMGAKILGSNLPGRITYADWAWELAEFAEENGFSIYLLGGKPGVAEKAAEKLIDKYPDLHILGTRHGYFDKSPESEENRFTIREINEFHPNILLICFGMPIQERWLMENWGNIDANVALTGGAALDYVSGELQRAPSWLTDHNLEWFGRLSIEPRRLWKRYVIGNPLFLYRILLQKFGFLRV